MDSRHPLPQLLASLYLDGDRLALVLGELRGQRYAIVRAEHRQLARPFEKRRRLHHPVHNDSSFSVYTDEAFFHEEVSGLLGSLPEEARILTVLAPDKERRAARKGGDSAEERAERRRHLFQRVLPLNPLDYPTLLVSRDIPREEGTSCTRVLTARMAEWLPLHSLVRDAGRDHWGTVPGLTASAEIAAALRPALGVERLGLMDFGALRTVFISADASRAPRSNVIPVGYLSGRDRAASGRSVEEEVRHFARRFFTEYATEGGEERPHDYRLLGFPGRSAGIPEELAAAVGCEIGSVAHEHVSALVGELPGGASFPPLSLAIGGLLAAASEEGRGFGLLHGELVSPPMSAGKCAVSRMKDGRLYVFEQRLPL